MAVGRKDAQVAATGLDALFEHGQPSSTKVLIGACKGLLANPLRSGFGPMPGLCMRQLPLGHLC